MRVRSVTGRGKRVLEDYFDISYELEHKIHGSEKEKFTRELMETCTFSTGVHGPWKAQVHLQERGHDMDVL